MNMNTIKDVKLKNKFLTGNLLVLNYTQYKTFVWCFFSLIS